MPDSFIFVTLNLIECSKNLHSCYQSGYIPVFISITSETTHCIIEDDKWKQ